VWPELAIALPAVGATCSAVLRSRQRAALAAGAGLGLAGLASVVLTRPGTASGDLGFEVALPAAGRALVIAAALAVALLVGLNPPRIERASLLTWGLAGIAGMAAIAAAPNLDLVVLTLLALAVLNVTLSGRRTLASRLRAPVLSVALIAMALMFARVTGPAILSRFAAVGFVAGLTAGLGLLPYIHEFDPEERTVASPIPWIAFVGPVLAIAIVPQARGLVTSAGDAFGAMLIGLGLLNMVWGCVASWRTESAASAWHFSFMADWGLALCGFGLAISDGQAAAFLVLWSILLARLPLYLWSRQSLREKTSTDRPINLLAAALLAGAAPFAGFAARVFLLRGATQLYWPLALVLALCMLLWLPPSLRLGRSLGLPRGRQAVGVGISVAVNLVIGLYPQPLLALAGL
jgi:hypothetical protein